VEYVLFFGKGKGTSSKICGGHTIPRNDPSVRVTDDA